MANADELLDARDWWDDAKWDEHFISFGREPSNGARYGTQHYDVLKQAIAHVHGRSCWWQGSISCESRALLLREAEIDHVVPKKARPGSLLQALSSSLYQQDYFDVHDPGNLAIICGPCNRDKGRHNETDYHPTPAIEKRRNDFEKNRSEVIKQYQKWHSIDKIDSSAVKILANINLSDEVVRSAYLDVAAAIALNLAEVDGVEFPIAFGTTISVEHGDYRLSLDPSDQACEDHVEMMEEMAADDRRAEERYGQ